MFCLRSNFHINELIRILQTKIHGVLQFHGLTFNCLKIKANKVLEGAFYIVAQCLMSGERFLAIRHSFAYETGLATEARIITTSVLVWIFAVSTYLIQHIFNRIRVLLTFVVIPTVAAFNVIAYRDSGFAAIRNKSLLIKFR